MSAIAFSTAITGLSGGKGKRQSVMADRASLKASCNRSRVDFVIADLDLGLTFSHMARGHVTQETKDRTRRSARRAYDTVVHFRDRVSATPAEALSIGKKLARLKSELQQLGECF